MPADRTSDTDIVDLRDDNAGRAAGRGVGRGVRLALDLSELHRQAGVVDPNPFMSPPPRKSAGFHGDSVELAVDGLQTGSVFLLAPRHGGKDRVQAGIADWMRALPDEVFITNPVPRDLKPSVVQPPRAAGSPAAVEPNGDRRSPSSAAPPSEEFTLVNEIHLAVLGLLSLMELPSEQRASKDRIMKLPRDGERIDPWALVEQIRTGLDEIAQKTDRCFVLRLTHVEALRSKQLEILGRIISRFDETQARVRFVVSGLPGAVSSLLGYVKPGTHVTALDLDWKLDAADRAEAVEHIIDLTRDSHVPFGEDIAAQIFDAADGIKSLINELGSVAWQRALDLQQATGQAIHAHDLRRVVDGVISDVLKAQEERYAGAIARLEQGDASARYVHALYELTKRTDQLLHDPGALLDMWEELYVPTARFLSAEDRLQRRERFAAEVDVRALHDQGFVTMNEDGQVGLADPQLGELVTKFVPTAAQTLV